MNPLALLPGTVGGWSALLAGIAVLLLWMFKNTKAAAWIGLVAGIGLGGWVGTALTSALTRAQWATGQATLKLFGSAVAVLFVVYLAFFFWRHAGNGRGSSPRWKFVPWLVLAAAIMLGSLVGALPFVNTAVEHAVASLNSIIR